MLKQQDSPSLTDYRVKSGTDRVRHVQWRKLSKKRKRKLVQRNLKNLENKARKKSLSFGLDDYSHIASLVYSELPYNPNGHHCSCNCIDEIEQTPNLEINGINYGKSRTASAFEAAENEHYALSLSLTSGRDSNLSGTSARGTSRNTYRATQSISRAKSDLGISPRQVCSKCKYVKCPQNVFNKNDQNNRRLSLAKEDGSLRSKIYGLKQKIRYYTDEIDRRENLSVQAIVKRRYTIAEQQLLQALDLSDDLRALKVKEMLYRSENTQLRKRIGDRSGTFIKDDELEDDMGNGGSKDENRINSDSACRSWLENVPMNNEPLEFNEENERAQNDSNSYRSSRRSSDRPTARMSAAYQLPALIEEEEDIRDGFHEDFIKEADPNNESKSRSYDILWINNEDENDETDLEEEDEYSKTWPTFQRYAAHQDFYDMQQGGRDGAKSNATIVNKTIADLNPVKKLVHRLESGLTFGLASPTRQIMDESVIELKKTIDDEKLAGSRLTEEQYNQPLIERQKSFGEIVRKAIREGILRRGSLVSEKRNSLSSGIDPELLEKKLKDEVTRRRSLAVDEDNIKSLVVEAQLKDQIVKEEMRKRSVVSLAKKDTNLDIESDKSDNESDSLKDESQLDGDEEKEDTEEADSSVKNVAAVAGKAHIVPNRKLYDLSTLRTVAQKHQTLRTLARLDEELYKVSDGTDKLNNYRKSQAKARVTKNRADETPRTERDALPLTRREEIFSIPEPINSRLLVESDLADNEKVISQIDFKYDMTRDLRFLMMNQNTSRAFSYSYLKPAPPYLKTKWENRIKRGFLRGVKEQKINEKQLETVEGVTHKLINRDVIHSETLKNTKSKRKHSESTNRSETRDSASARSSTALSAGSGKGRNYTLPPLQLPGSRTPSPEELSYREIAKGLRSQSVGPENLTEAFVKLSERHKFQEKDGLMRNVVRLSSYQRNPQSEDGVGTERSWSNRARNENETEERYTPRLNTSRRHSTFVQNVAVSDPQSGRISVNSYEGKRRLTLMHAIEEN